MAVERPAVAALLLTAPVTTGEVVLVTEAVLFALLGVVAAIFSLPSKHQQSPPQQHQYQHQPIVRSTGTRRFPATRYNHISEADAAAFGKNLLEDMTPVLTTGPKRSDYQRNGDQTTAGERPRQVFIGLLSLSSFVRAISLVTVLAFCNPTENERARWSAQDASALGGRRQLLTQQHQSNIPFEGQPFAEPVPTHTLDVSFREFLVPPATSVEPPLSSEALRTKSEQSASGTDFQAVSSILVLPGGTRKASNPRPTLGDKIGTTTPRDMRAGLNTEIMYTELSVDVAPKRRLHAQRSRYQTEELKEFENTEPVGGPMPVLVPEDVATAEKFQKYHTVIPENPSATPLIPFPPQAFQADDFERSDTREWYMYVLQAVPSLLFSCAFSVVVLFWAQVYYVASLVVVPALEPVFIALHFTLLLAFGFAAAITRWFGMYAQFGSLALTFVGGANLAVAFFFALFGFKLVSRLSQDIDGGAGVVGAAIARRVLILSVVCPILFGLRGIVSLTVSLGLVAHYHPGFCSRLLWDAQIYFLTEVVPVALILVMFTSKTTQSCANGSSEGSNSLQANSGIQDSYKSLGCIRTPQNSPARSMPYRDEAVLYALDVVQGSYAPAQPVHQDSTAGTHLEVLEPAPGTVALQQLSWVNPLTRQVSQPRSVIPPEPKWC